MNKLKICIFILILVGIIFVLPNISNAATIQATETTTTSTGAVVKWSYEKDSNNNVKDFKCINVASVTGELTIPQKIDGYSVTTLGYSAFKDCAGLQKVTFPNSLVKIDNYAFRYCTGLKSLVLPDSITSIGEYAFDNCTGIKTVKLSTNLAKLPYEAFDHCSGITEIELPENLTTMDSYCFGTCAIKYIKIPANVVSIADNAFGFSNTDNLTIFGVKGSTAEDFAKKKNIKFEEITDWANRSKLSTVPKVTEIKAKGKNLKDTSSGWEYQETKGNEVSVIIKFDQTIVLNESPKLTIKFGTGSNIVLTTEIATSDTLTYKYNIKSGDKGSLQIVSLEGGNVTNNGGIKANFDSIPSLSGKVVAIGEEVDSSMDSGKSSNTSETPSSSKDNSSSNGATKNTDKATDNTEKTNEEDNTIKKASKLPQTGTLLISAIIVILIGILTISKFKYGKYKDVV